MNEIPCSYCKGRPEERPLLVTIKILIEAVISFYAMPPSQAPQSLS
jgi:hypothetical protein